MTDYILVRKSQAHFYIKTPLYIKNKSGDFVLYKGENEVIDTKRFTEEQFPNLYTTSHMQEFAKKELYGHLSKQLTKEIENGELGHIKETICEIVQESMTEPSEENFSVLPETIDILYSEYSGAKDVVKNFIDICYGGTSLINHSVNVMVLALNYCLFCNFSENDTKKLSLMALLHDVGLTKLPKKIIESERKLTDEEFAVYQTHSLVGHDIIRDCIRTDPSVATGILEHHERLDGEGYPNGISNISFDGGLLGLIDSFESLTNSKKNL